MTTRDLIFLSLSIFPLMARVQQPNKDSGKVTVHEVRFKELIDEDVDPPPPHLSSKFTTLTDWLLNVCEKDRPQKSISIFKFGLFESANDYTLFLIGTNTYDEGQNHSVTRIEFQPTNMYFKLPQKNYKGLNRDQVIGNLTSQLKDFAQTQMFKTSFLAQATTVVFTVNGETIWSK
jgi:hypothetical protein